MNAVEVDLERLRGEIGEKIERFRFETSKLQSDFYNSMEGLEKKGVKVDKEKIKDFMSKFWHTYPTKNPMEWEVAVPVFIPFNIGWFDRTEGGYNIFTINKYTRWLGEAIPAFISHEISIPPSFNISVDGSDMAFEEGKQEQIEKLFGSHLTLVGKDKATVKQGHEFDLIADIIESGSLPFKPKPVLESDLMESDFTTIYDEIGDKRLPLQIFDGKYSYQGEAWETFKKYGAIGVFWAMSFGKTVIGTYCLSRIKGPKCLVVPTTTLKEHWTEFFKQNCPRLLNEVDIFTYQGMSRKSWSETQKKDYSLITFDECHFLPADSFSKLATIKAKYRIGLSATPYREDGRTNYIMALTGYPTGLDWKMTMQVLGKEYHTVNVHVVKDAESKYDLIRQLYNPERRTIVFVNLLNIGRRIAEDLKIPMISGETKNRMKVIKENTSFVATRVLELGVSIKDLEHIIEADFLFGSRREEVQRTGRLMHSIAEGKVHDIIMTKTELEQYGKRLYGLYEKGFKYKLIPHLSGIEKPAAIGAAKSRKPATQSGGMNYRKIVDELYSDGYFQKERLQSDVRAEIERRGGRVDSALSMKLTDMTRAGKLYKIKTDNGFVFKQR